MKIAIHHRKGSFSDGWIAYCEQNHIEYKIVDAYANDIIQQVAGCDYFMWHFHHIDYRDMQLAKILIASLESKGIKCFPNSNTCWHFDNKVAQKYLLEAVEAPLVTSYVFYTKEEALGWARNSTFPKIFKLKGGAGAHNVKMAHNRKEAEAYIEQCFGKGFRQYRWREHCREYIRKYKIGKASLGDIVRPIKRALKKYPTEFDHYGGREIGYAYFQEFIPNNTFDIRAIVIGNKLLAEKRYVRQGDFRASGSGAFEYGNIPDNVIQTAFDVAKSLKTQCVAFDFVFQDDMPKIIEMSYGFGTHGISQSGGYWTEDLVWHEDNTLDFCGWMIENLIK